MQTVAERITHYASRITPYHRGGGTSWKQAFIIEFQKQKVLTTLRMTAATTDIPTKTRVWMQYGPLDRKDNTNVEGVKKCIRLEEVPIPELKPQQLLIKVERCTINPNELLHLFGTYGLSEHILYPRPAAGFEGSGTVVKSTASWYMPQAGQTVAFYGVMAVLTETT